MRAPLKLCFSSFAVVYTNLVILQSFPPMRKPFLTYSECFAVAEYIMKRKDAYCNGCYVQDLEFAEGGGSEHLCF